MRTPRVSLEVTCGIQHVHQILTGFLLLSRRGEVELTTTLLPRAKSPYPFLVNARIGGSRVVYDLQDGILTPETEENDRIFREADVLFARGYVAGSYGPWESKVVPLGLNYYVTLPHPVSVRARLSPPIRLLVKNLASRAIRRRPPAGISTFEIGPDAADAGGGLVVFATRVWDPPLEVPNAPPHEVTDLNDSRAEAVRALREAFGPRFWGGVAPTEYAVKHYPDVLADRQNVGQRAYLSAVRRAAVCVTTRGLGGSNGWKLAEFVAGSRAIAVERPEQSVPGPFADGSNYLAFDTPEGMVAAVSRLLGDDKLRADMARRNWDYYRNYVRPDALVRRTVTTVTDRELAAGGPVP